MGSLGAVLFHFTTEGQKIHTVESSGDKNKRRKIIIDHPLRAWDWGALPLYAGVDLV